MALKLPVAQGLNMHDAACLLAADSRVKPGYDDGGGSAGGAAADFCGNRRGVYGRH